MSVSGTDVVTTDSCTDGEFDFIEVQATELVDGFYTIFNPTHSRYLDQTADHTDVVASESVGIWEFVNKIAIEN